LKPQTHNFQYVPDRQKQSLTALNTFKNPVKVVLPAEGELQDILYEL